MFVQLPFNLGHRRGHTPAVLAIAVVVDDVLLQVLVLVDKLSCKQLHERVLRDDKHLCVGVHARREVIQMNSYEIYEANKD